MDNDIDVPQNTFPYILMDFFYELKRIHNLYYFPYKKLTIHNITKDNLGFYFVRKLIESRKTNL